MELPCPHCGSMQPAPQLQQHIKIEHADAGQQAAASAADAASSSRPGKQKPAPAAPGEQKLNPARKHLAAFAKLKEAVKEANKDVLAARKKNMPDASRLPPSARGL